MMFEPQICPWYKEEVHKAAAIVLLCILDQKTSLHVMAMKKPISYLYNLLARSVHLAFAAARRPPAAVKKNERLAGSLKTDAKCGYGFRENECNNWDISHFL